MPKYENHRGAQLFAVPKRKRLVPAREELHYLASALCASCAGTGWKKEVRCGCVLRRISRVAIDRLHVIAARGPHPNHHVFSRDGEYSADLWNVARRALNSAELRIFEKYLLFGLPWNKLASNRGEFFHSVYRAEQKFGAALLEHGCFPPHAYFSGLREADPEHVPHGKGYMLRERFEDEDERPLPMTADKIGTLKTAA